MPARTARDDHLNVRLLPDPRCVAFVFGRAAEPAAGGSRISSDGLLVHCGSVYPESGPRPLARRSLPLGERACVFSRRAFAARQAFALSAAPVRAERQIVDLHRLDAYFALFANDSNVPWKPTTVRLDTYSSAPVSVAVYQADPADVLTAGSNARPRAIVTRGRRPVSSFSFSPPGGYQFQSNYVDVQLGSREGFFVVEARRGDVGEEVWINRTRVGLVSKETPGELVLYGADLGTGRSMAGMRVQFVVGNRFVSQQTDARGIVRWKRYPRPVFALAQWASSYAFLSPLPQSPLPAAIVAVRTDSAVVHAGDVVRVVGFARSRAGSSRCARAAEMRPCRCDPAPR